MKKTKRTAVRFLPQYLFFACEIAMLSAHDIINWFDPNCIKTIPKNALAFIISWVLCVMVIAFGADSRKAKPEKTKRRILNCLAIIGLATQIILLIPRYALTSDKGLIEYGQLNQIIREIPENEFENIEIGIDKTNGSKGRKIYRCCIRFKAAEKNFTFRSENAKALRYYNRMKESRRAKVSDNGYATEILRKTKWWSRERRRLVRRLFNW